MFEINTKPRTNDFSLNAKFFLLRWSRKYYKFKC